MGKQIELAVAIVISHALRIVLGDVSAVQVWPQAPKETHKTIILVFPPEGQL